MNRLFVAHETHKKGKIMEETNESRKAVAFIRSNNRREWPSFISLGEANGYVAVLPGNRYHGKHYDDVDDIYVHGGLSFSEPAYFADELDAEPYDKEEYAGRMNPILEGAEFVDGNPEDIGKDWWVFGFDTFHFGDNPEEWDREAVIRETLHLMGQLTEEEEK